MLENFKEALYKGNSVSAIFMDLIKVFDTVNHDLLIAKHEAYGFCGKSISYIHSYLSKRLQKTNVNCDFIPWKEIFSAVPQGSTFDPFLFNIYIHIYITEIFFLVAEAFLSNYADDRALQSFQKKHILNQSIRKILCIYRNCSMIII